MEVVYKRPEITEDSIALSQLGVLGSIIYGTDEPIETIEGFAVALFHFKFLYQYGL